MCDPKQSDRTMSQLESSEDLTGLGLPGDFCIAPREATPICSGVRHNQSNVQRLITPSGAGEEGEREAQTAASIRGRDDRGIPIPALPKYPPLEKSK